MGHRIMARNFLAATAMIGAMVGAPGSHAEAPMTSIALDGDWRLRLADGDAHAQQHTGFTGWMAAHVPGTVQTDLLALGKLPDPYLALNEAQVQWVGLSNWRYERHFSVDAATLRRGHVDLVFDGLDTFATVRVNGAVVLSADNMFRRWRVPVKTVLRPGDNVVTVDLASPIARMQPFVASQAQTLPGAYDSAFGDEPPGRNSSPYVRKAGYHYGWDWGPRVVELGIWKPVRLEAYDQARAHDFHVAQISLDDAMADLSIETEIDADRAGTVSIDIVVAAPDSSRRHLRRDVAVHRGENHLAVPVRIAHPQRWWPVGYGRPDRYGVSVAVRQNGVEIGRHQGHIGLRTVELRREHDQWGRSFAFVVNGVPIYAKGANLIPFDMLPTRVSAEDETRLLRSAVDANMNMLRVWGGGVYPDDHLYDEADRLGLMIWQDFMFGGSIPPDDEAFRANVAEEAAEQVQRLRDHPSLVLFAGNNEVQTNWENWGGSTAAFKKALSPEQRDRIVAGMVRLFDRTLRDAVARYSPQTPYWASSPSTDYEGPADRDDDGDRHYWGVWGGKPVEDYLTLTPRFMSEFGLQSLPEITTIRRFAGPGPLSLDAPVMRAHQKYDGGNGNVRLLSYISRNYGEPRSFEDAVYLSQLMQAEGIELAVLHLRASRPRNMGALFWQLNDVWPGASWSSIDHLGRWKALQYHARRFYAPLAAGLVQGDGAIEASILSDRTAAVPLTWRLSILDFAGHAIVTHSGALNAPALAATPVMRIREADLPRDVDPTRSQILFEISRDGQSLSRSFGYFRAARELRWADPQLSTRLAPEQGGYALTISAASAARGVWVDTGGLAISLSDNAFDMAGGTSTTVHLRTALSQASVADALRVRFYHGAAR